MGEQYYYQTATAWFILGKYVLDYISSCFSRSAMEAGRPFRITDSHRGFSDFGSCQNYQTDDWGSLWYNWQEFTCQTTQVRRRRYHDAPNKCDGDIDATIYGTLKDCEARTESFQSTFTFDHYTSGYCEDDKFSGLYAEYSMYNEYVYRPGTTESSCSSTYSYMNRYISPDCYEEPGESTSIQAKCYDGELFLERYNGNLCFGTPTQSYSLASTSCKRSTDDSNDYSLLQKCAICGNGWSGTLCNQCVAPFTGAECNSCVSPFVYVEKDDGAVCECENYWSGPACDVCDPIYFTGADCDQCANHWSGDNCDVCEEPFDGATCSECSNNWYGSDCDQCDFTLYDEECKCKSFCELKDKQNMTKNNITELTPAHTNITLVLEEFGEMYQNYTVDYEALLAQVIYAKVQQDLAHSTAFELIAILNSAFTAHSIELNQIKIDAESSKNTMNSKYNELEQRINDLENVDVSVFEELEEQLNKIDLIPIAEMETDVLAKKTQIEEAKEKVMKMHEDIYSISNDLETITNNIKDLEDELNTKLETLVSKINIEQTKNLDQDIQIAELKTTITKVTNDLESQIDENKDTLDNNCNAQELKQESDITSVETLITSLTQLISNLETTESARINTNEIKIEEQEKEIENYEIEFHSKINSIDSDIKADIVTIEESSTAKNLANQANINTMQAKLSTLQTKNVNQKQKIEELKNSTTNTQSVIDDQNARIATLESEGEKNKEKLFEQNLKIAELEKKLAEVSANSEESVDGVQSNLNSFSTTTTIGTVAMWVLFVLLVIVIILIIVGVVVYSCAKCTGKKKK